MYIIRYLTILAWELFNLLLQLHDAGVCVFSTARDLVHGATQDLTRAARRGAWFNQKVDAMLIAWHLQ